VLAVNKQRRQKNLGKMAGNQTDSKATAANVKANTHKSVTNPNHPQKNNAKIMLQETKNVLSAEEGYALTAQIVQNREGRNAQRTFVLPLNRFGN